jgi:hypothetical protein
MSLLFQEGNRLKMLAQLEGTSAIEYEELLRIATAFQVASGQSFAIGSTKGILEHLKKGNTVTILNQGEFPGPIKLVSVVDLAKAFKNIDQHIDLVNDSDFKNFF